MLGHFCLSPLVSLSLSFLNLRFSLSISSFIAPPLPPPQVASRKRRKKIKKPSRTLMRENSPLSSMGCGSFFPNAKQDVFLLKLGYHLRLPTRQQWRLGHYPLITARGESNFPFFLARWNSRIFMPHKIKCSAIGVLDFLIICFSLIPFDNHVDLFDNYS